MFGKLLESFPPQPQLRNGTSHYGLYGEPVESSCPLLVGRKGENVKSGDAQHDNGNASHLSSDIGSESEVENDAGGEGEDGSGGEGEDGTGGEGEDGSGREGEDDTSGESKDGSGREGENDASGEVEDDAGKKSEDNNGEEDNDDNGGQGEDDAGRNDETLNVKSRVGDDDETSNFDEIAIGKLASCYIANALVDIPAHSTIALVHPAIPLVILLVLSVSGFATYGNTAPGFPAPGCLTPGLFVLLVSGSPALPRLDSSVVPLVCLDTFSPYFSLAPNVDDGIVKLLVEVIANVFGDNPSVIAHRSHDSCTS